MARKPHLAAMTDEALAEYSDLIRSEHVAVMAEFSLRKALAGEPVARADDAAVEHVAELPFDAA